MQRLAAREDTMNLVQKLRYMGKQYAAGQEARGGGAQKHYLEEAADEIERLRGELANIANAKRFDRSVFDDDTVFADWAQSRCRYVGRGDAAADAEMKVERTPTVCTKDPRGCWNARCQLGKHRVKDVTNVR